MIDTVALYITENDFHILDHQNFTPSTLPLFRPPYYAFGNKKYIACINNPTKKMKEAHIYLPRVKVTKSIRSGGFQTSMKIEFSIPKLLYGNNFEEVNDSDFELVVKTLKEKLEIMKVLVSEKAIRDAKVIALHYGKNFILSDGEFCIKYISELQKADISKWNDTNQTNFRNQGTSFKYHTNNHEVIFYDKLKDLEQAKKSEKRCIENDNILQLNLLDELKKLNQILRYEFRMNKTQTIKRKLKPFVDENFNCLFYECFDSKLSMNVLSSGLQKIINRIPKIFLASSNSIEELFFKLNERYPNYSFNKIMQLIGVIKMQEEVGTKYLRNVAEAKGVNWSKYKSPNLNIQLNNETTSPLYKLINEMKLYNAVKLYDYRKYEEIINGNKKI